LHVRAFDSEGDRGPISRIKWSDGVLHEMRVGVVEKDRYKKVFKRRVVIRDTVMQ
jgi:hypothetical protein